MATFFGLSNPGETLTFTALLSWSPVDSVTFTVGYTNLSLAFFGFQGGAIV